MYGDKTRIPRLEFGTSNMIQGYNKQVTKVPTGEKKVVLRDTVFLDTTQKRTVSELFLPKVLPEHSSLFYSWYIVDT